jgi:hypothetical protein
MNDQWAWKSWGVLSLVFGVYIEKEQSIQLRSIAKSNSFLPFCDTSDFAAYIYCRRC